MLHPRNGAGEFLSLSHLIGILPSDYMVTIFDGEKELWRGIAWVFVCDKIYFKYQNYGVKKFDTDFYNENFLIWIYVRRNYDEAARCHKNVL